MTRDGRRAEAAVVWALSAVLSAVFLVAGLPKLLGMSAVGLEAAAMSTFPQWLRVVVGIVEVAAAIGLLIPSVSAGSAMVLALLMIPATITQFVSGDPGVWVPILLFGLLLLVAWRREAATVLKEYRGLRDTPHPILREGAIAGIIGATVVAAWFFFIDWMAGRPLFTPAVLGRALISILGPVPEGESMFLHVAAYTVVHYAAFIAVGAFASLIIHEAGHEASILLGSVMLFVVFEVAFSAFVALLEQVTELRVFAWYQVAVGNLLAAASMGIYLWRAHAELREEFAHALDPDFHPPVTDEQAGMYTAPLGIPRGGRDSSS